MTSAEKRVVENLRDSILIVSHRNGDLRAFGKLTDLHRVELNWFNYKILHNHEDAEDATQEIFIICSNSFSNGKYIEHQAFGGWLKKTASYYLSHIQRRGIVLTVQMEYELPAELIELFEDIDLTEERIEKLMEAVNALSERDVRLLTMRYWEKMSWREIGEALNIDERAASSQHCKILKKLKNKMLENIFLNNGRTFNINGIVYMKGKK